jgi:hypothetical protein
MRFAPTVKRSYARKDMGREEENTLKYDTKRALPNLLPDTKMVTDYAGCSRRLRGMG